MKIKRFYFVFLALIAAVLAGAILSMAQQIIGEPGSPSATISIDGRQRPLL